MNYDQLIQNLESQAKEYGNMLEALEAEIMLAASASLEDLISCQTEKEKAAVEVRELEQQRQGLVYHLIREHNLSSHAKLEELVEYTDEKRGNRLLDLKSHLIDLVNHIQSQGRFVAERSMLRRNCITEVQNNLSKHFKNPCVYGKSGKIAKPQGGFIYNSQA